MTVVRHLGDSAGRTTSTGDDAVGTRTRRTDYSDQVILLGRVKPGRARESRRVAHVFLLLGSEVAPDSTLTARCGEELLVGDMDWLPGMVGMPCEPCVLHAMADRP
jgi:hypothetical protein